MRMNPPAPWACETWKIFCSASSSSSAAVSRPSKASPTMLVDVSIRRRRSAFSLTIAAWYSVFEAVGTASSRKEM